MLVFYCYIPIFSKDWPPKNDGVATSAGFVSVGILSYGFLGNFGLYSFDSDRVFPANENTDAGLNNAPSATGAVYGAYLTSNFSPANVG